MGPRRWRLGIFSLPNLIAFPNGSQKTENRCTEVRAALRGRNPCARGAAFKQFVPRPSLCNAAAATLRNNWVGTSTVPAHGLYPHQWSWDTAFIAFGHSVTNLTRAQLELETLFDAQWANGMLPHIVFNPDVPSDAYFPGPAYWRSSP